MNKSTSLYLDFLRVIAAFGVMLVHANLPWFSAGLFLRAELGHKFVMVFFVLSGYLIAFTVDKKNKGPKTYLVDRLSRLYSVVLPALIFTYLIDFIGQKLSPGFYADKINFGQPVLRFLLNFTYLQQVWNLCTKPSSNTPFWSISYEFWYYMLYFVLCYYQGTKRYIGVAIVCLITGLKILLLLPVWLLGAYVYKAANRSKLNNRTAQVLFVLSAAAVIGCSFLGDIGFLARRFGFGRPPLYFSSQFLFDWGYGCLVALNIYSFSLATFSFKMPDFLARVIKHFSSITFTLYLFHIPILYFIASQLKYDKTSYLQVVSLLCFVLMLVNLLAYISERQRNYLKDFFNKALGLFMQ